MAALMGRPPDAPWPRRAVSMEGRARIERLLIDIGAAFAVVLIAGIAVWMYDGVRPLPPVATPSAPQTIVVAPSPDAGIASAVARIERNTAALPTLAAAYAIEQTKTSGANLATWAALQQGTAAGPTPAPCLGCIRGRQ